MLYILALIAAFSVSMPDSAAGTDWTMTCWKASRSTYFCTILLNDWSAGNPHAKHGAGWRLLYFIRPLGWVFR